MAHNLTIDTATGRVSMMYYGEPPWHGLGKKLDSPATAAEAIQAAGLDWKVEKKQLFFEYQPSTYYKVPAYYAIVRLDKIEKPLGIVGKDYTPLQNDEAFQFFDPIVDKKAAIFHTAGSLGNGERIWMLAKLPDQIRVIGDDVADKYLLLSNSHDGTSTVQIKFTPVRVVCQNTLTMALQNGSPIRVRHNWKVKKKVQEASNLLGFISKRYEYIAETFRAMVKVKMDKTRYRSYLQEVFPDPKPRDDEEQYNKELKRVQNLRACCEHFGNEGKGNNVNDVKHTLWAAYNGIVEYIDQCVPSSKKSQPSIFDVSTDRKPRLDYIWFGEGYLIKSKAYRIAERLLKSY